MQGATIKWDDVLGSVVIARVMHGGAADRSGLIHVGDVVHEVNGVDVRGRDPDEVVGLLVRIDKWFFELKLEKRIVNLIYLC